jgi:inorganic pyrophosphatase
VAAARVFIEIPKGSRNKYEYDAELGGIKLDRFLFSSITYPADYGFFPDTEGEDGDALDAIMLVDKPTFPGCRVDVRPIAVLRLKADEGSDDKVVCVPYKDPAWAEYETLESIPRQLRREIEHFFSIYKEPEGRSVDLSGFEDRDVAERLVDEALERFSSRDRAQ